MSIGHAAVAGGHSDRKARPASLLGWLTTVDHKRIGILYMCTALLFFGVAGLEALLIRIQLAAPRSAVLSPGVYNQIFTLHGTTMVFLVGMPVLVGFANYMVPLMIGAKDVAFPRLNAMSYWMLPFGGFLLHYSVLTGRAPDAGWFSYVPLATKAYTSLQGVDYWILGLLTLGIGSVAAGINLIVTIVCERAPGMSLQRLPLFVWMFLTTSFLTVVAIAALNGALALLLFDRWLSAAFFEPDRGGSAVLWQHFFWVFGHPEVYILVLPAFGMISEVIPVFSRKPIYGYEFVAGSTIAIGLLSLGVWAHHMFAVGLGSAMDIFFAATSLLIAIPTGIKIFNWTATMWGGSIRFTTSMMFAVAFLLQFIIGGLSGVAFATVPVDWQLTDTYFVVAHLHYVLFGGTMFALFAGTYYWFPKITGRLLSERLGRLHFWAMVLGFNVTFFVQHVLGLMGMPRRVYTYDDAPGWGALNLLSTIGALILGAGVLVFVWNVIRSLRRGEPAGSNPWGAFTLEWATDSPPPPENFRSLPEIKGRRPVWDMDHPDKADWKVRPTSSDSGRRPARAICGAWMFIASEVMFFIILLSSFVVFDGKGESGGSASLLDIPRTGVFTGVLLASSVTCWLGVRSLRRGRRGQSTLWLLATVALGIAFLANQGVEYAGLFGEGLSMSSGLFAATFFTVTGFHALHVFAGLVALGTMLGFMRTGALGQRNAHVLDAISLYWHFVDVVWIAVFSIIYLGVLR